MNKKTIAWLSALVTFTGAWAVADFVNYPAAGPFSVTQLTSPWVVSGTVAVSSTVLPTGASTAAKQDTGNASLASMDSKIVAVNTGAVVVSSSALPAGASTAAKQDAGNLLLGTINANIDVPLSGRASEVTLSSINAKTVAVDTGNVTVVSASLPAGASTEAKQDTANASLASLDAKLNSLGQKTMTGSVPVVLASDQSALGVTGSGNFTVVQPTGTNLHAVVDSGLISAAQSGSWDIANITGTVSLPTGASTGAKQDTGNTTLGSILTRLLGTLDVASNQAGVWSTRGLDGSGNLLTSQVSGSQQALDVGVNVAGVQVDPRSIRALTSADVVSAAQSGVWNITNVSGTVSLPTGASTSANQTTANASLSSIDGKLGTLGQKAMTGSAPVVIASDQSAIPASQSGTWNVTNVSGTVSLPTGASTAAKQDTGNTSVASIDGKLGTLGQKTMSGSAPVVLASDQSAIPVTQGAHSVATTARNDYSSVNVTSGAWVQLVASLGSTVSLVEIFDSSGQTLELGTGGAGAETRLILITPGGNGQVPVSIASGTRLSVRAVSATANSGEIDLNLYN